MDGRNERLRGRQALRNAISRRLQSFFITLRSTYPENANTRLQRAEEAEEQAPTRTSP